MAELLAFLGFVSTLGALFGFLGWLRAWGATRKASLALEKCEWLRTEIIRLNIKLVEQEKTND